MRDDSHLESGLEVDSARSSWRSGLATASGAVISLMILITVVVWSYRLGSRDAEDIPVIRAEAGAAKIRPEEPGGLEVSFQDRTVYDAVTGEEGDEEAGLAPPPERLANDDVPAVAASPEPAPKPQSAAGETDGETAQDSSAQAGPAPDDTTPEPPASAEAPEPEAVVSVEQPPADAPVDAPADAPAEESVDESTLIQNAVDAVLAQSADEQSGESATDGAGPQYAPPAAPRPDRAAAAPQRRTDRPEPSSAAAAASPVQVQLGAYLSEEIAADQWSTIKARNGDLLSGRGRVISAVQSGGRTLYRLRAGPFDKPAEASALCRGLKARNEACIVARAQE